MATIAELQAYAQTQAERYGVPPALFVAQISQESGWNPNATNPNSSAYGIAQILSGTASQPGYGIQPVSNRADPYESLSFAAQYDAALYQKTGSWTGALNAYGTGATSNSTIANILQGLGENPYAGSSGAPGFADNPIQLDPNGNVVPNSGAAGAAGGSSSYAGAIPAWFKMILGGLGSGVAVIAGLILLAGAVFLFGRK